MCIRICFLRRGGSVCRDGVVSQHFQPEFSRKLRLGWEPFRLGRPSHLPLVREGAFRPGILICNGIGLKAPRYTLLPWRALFAGHSSITAMARFVEEALAASRRERSVFQPCSVTRRLCCADSWILLRNTMENPDAIKRTGPQRGIILSACRHTFSTSALCCSALCA